MIKKFWVIIVLFLMCPAFVLAEQIDINSATLSQLDELTDVGPVIAQRIIDARPFFSVDDLERVKGIGPKTLQKIKDQGLACVNCATTDEKHETSDITPAGVMSEVNATYPDGIFINEILPNPEGADETDEWIELFNSSNFDVDLSDWQLQDITGTSKAYTISEDAKILANGYLVFKRSDTKIMLNNDGDGLILLTPDSKTEDTINFNNAPLGQSYNKTANGWVWSVTLTPGTANVITSAQTKSDLKGLPKTQKSDKNNVSAEDLTAGLSSAENVRGSTLASPWLLFFVTLGAAIVSATAVLFIRLKFKNLKI